MSDRNRHSGVHSGEPRFPLQACVWSPLESDWRLRAFVDLARRSGTAAACRRSRVHSRLGRRFGVEHPCWTRSKHDLPPVALPGSTIASATRLRLNEAALERGPHPSSAPLSNLPPQLRTDDFRLLPMLQAPKRAADQSAGPSAGIVSTECSIRPTRPRRDDREIRLRRIRDNRCTQ